MTPITLAGLVPPSDNLFFVEWLVGEGDEVAAGQEIANVEADKAQVVVVAPASGSLVEQLAKPDDEITLDTVLGTIAS